ncbi:MAG: HEAT repeat domain-containing protein [Verrucomicrobiota bacterium]
MKSVLVTGTIGVLAAATAFLGWKAYGPGPSDTTSAPAVETAPRTDNNQPLNEAKAPVPHLIRELTSPGKHLSEQIEAVRNLPDDLDEAEFEALIAILHQPSPPKTDLGRWYTLQNEIMEVLREPRYRWDGYPGAMSDLVTDRHADPVMRDYAAQHLALYLGDRADRLESETTSAALDAFVDVISGSREAHEQVAGTTLMALCDLNSRRPEILEDHRAALESAIEGLMSPDAGASLSNQIAAIQSAGRLDFPSLRPNIRSLAGSEAANASLRLSSIAALGYFADPSDRAFLTDLAEGESRLRYAARTALKNFK